MRAEKRHKRQWARDAKAVPRNRLHAGPGSPPSCAERDTSARPVARSATRQPGRAERRAEAQKAKAEARAATVAEREVPRSPYGQKRFRGTACQPQPKRRLAESDGSTDLSSW
jgi:hypothetical protein